MISFRNRGDFPAEQIVGLGIGGFATIGEAIKEMIAAGKLADLVVLFGDTRAIAAEDLSSLAVELTVVDGRVAFEHAG